MHPVGIVQNKESMSLKFLLLGMRSETNFPRSPGLSLYGHISLICFAKFNFNWVSRNTLSKVEILVLQVFES